MSTRGVLGEGCSGACGTCQGTGVSAEGSAWDPSLQVRVGISPLVGKQKAADGAVGEGAVTLCLGTNNICGG